MQVHDELIFDVKKAEVLDVLSIIKHSMEQGFNLSLPLKASIVQGNNWGELK